MNRLKKSAEKQGYLHPRSVSCLYNNCFPVVCRILPHCAHVADMNFCLSILWIPIRTVIRRWRLWSASNFSKGLSMQNRLFPVPDLHFYGKTAPPIFLSGFLQTFSGQIPFFFYFRTEGLVSGGLVPSTPERKKSRSHYTAIAV